MNNSVIVLVSTEITNQQLAITTLQLVSGYSLLTKGGLMPSFEVIREDPHHILMKKHFFEKNGTVFSEVENGEMWGICYDGQFDKSMKYARHSKKYLKDSLTKSNTKAK